MVTMVGNANDFPQLITDYIQLERDAISAYDACIERLDDPGRKAKVSEFRADHERHLTELNRLASEVGAENPADTSAKEMLTSGKVKLADIVGGDGAILRAMATNENDTETAYHNGVENAAIPAAEKEIFARALADERRHKAWMEAEAGRA